MRYTNLESNLAIIFKFELLTISYICFFPWSVFWGPSSISYSYVFSTHLMINLPMISHFRCIICFFFFLGVGWVSYYFVCNTHLMIVCSSSNSNLWFHIFVSSFILEIEAFVELSLPLHLIPLALIIILIYFWSYLSFL